MLIIIVDIEGRGPSWGHHMARVPHVRWTVKERDIFIRIIHKKWQLISVLTIPKPCMD